MKLNKDPSKLRRGQQVTTDFDQYPDVLRTITEIYPVVDGVTDSGYQASVEAVTCKECKHVIAAITRVDAAWFVPISEFVITKTGKKP